MASMRKSYITFLMLAAPAVLFAQRGGGRSGGRMAEQPSAEFMRPPRPAPSITEIVLSHEKDLSLSDSQRVTMQALRAVQDSMTKPWMQKLDSLRPQRMPANGPNDLSQEQRDEMEARSKMVAGVMEQIREANAEVRIKVMAALNPEQQKRTAEFEEEEHKKTEADNRKRMGGESMGGRRRGPED